jgi:anti-sigma-K factor RskA
MARRQPLVLLLWGDQFDEAAAALFVSALRAAGVQVRVVGVDGRTASGRHGLQVSADLTLHRALALSNRVTHVVLPCAVTHFHRLREDPLVTRLLDESAAAGAQFLISVQPESCTGCNVLPLPAAAPPLPLERVRAYPEVDLTEFTNQMAGEIRSQ